MDVGAVMVGLFVLVYLCLALAALRRPLLARLAFREAVRRPWQSALPFRLGWRDSRRYQTQLYHRQPKRRFLR